VGIIHVGTNNIWYTKIMENVFPRGSTLARQKARERMVLAAYRDNCVSAVLPKLSKADHAILARAIEASSGTWEGVFDGIPFKSKVPFSD
jgi:hypothetical protein